MNDLIIKTYDIDYSFILKNYLNKELWKKEWTLFVYKNIVFTLSLSKIDTEYDIIEFKISVKRENYRMNTYINYFFNQSNLKILKKQINGAMFELINCLENHDIRNEEGYKTIKDGEYEEEEMLKEIAEEFLNDEGVSNEEIRECYIDSYISNNKKTDIYLSNYLNGREYLVLSDLYLVCTKVFEDKNRYDEVVSKIEKEPTFMSTLAEANKYINQLQNEKEREVLVEEFKESLEAI